jgi:hypothetical protein
MKLIMIAAAATIAMALPALAQTQSEPANTVGSGTAKAVDPGDAQRVGKPVTPSSMRRHAINQPGAAPSNGTEKPAGTTGAPPYGSTAPKPNTSTGAEPDGG